MKGGGDVTQPRARPTIVRLSAPLLISTIVCAAVAAAGAAQPPATVVTGFTEPVEQAVLSALQQARINAFAVDEGAAVKAGDAIVVFEQAAQQARVAKAKLDAESTAAVDLADVRLAYARSELERLQRFSSDVTATKELADARFLVDTRRLELELARLEHARAGREYETQKGLLAELTVTAPFDGYVADRLKSPGETVVEGEGIISLVRIDPLLVSVNAPADLIRTARVGDSVSVTPVDLSWGGRTGTIRFINRVIDPASQTVLIRVQIPNADRAWAAGVKVDVQFSAKDAGEAQLARERGESDDRS